MRGAAILSGSVCCLLLPAPLQAETASGTMQVSLSVLPGCAVSAAPLAFAAVAGSTAEAEAAIDVRCTSDTRLSLSLDAGRHAAGSQRRLTSEAGDAVPYAIYSDAARTRAWTGGRVAGQSGPDRAWHLVAYGRVEPRESAVPAGEYRDSVTITVEF